MDTLAPMLALGLLYMLVSHPKMYEFTSGLLGTVLPDLELVEDNGCPTMMGQALHAVVLVLLVWVVNNYLLNNNPILMV